MFCSWLLKIHVQSVPLTQAKSWTEQSTTRKNTWVINGCFDSNDNLEFLDFCCNSVFVRAFDHFYTLNVSNKTTLWYFRPHHPYTEFKCTAISVQSILKYEKIVSFFFFCKGCKMNEERIKWSAVNSACGGNSADLSLKLFSAKS